MALQKCVTYALERGIDTFVFLGDYVGELAYPQRTMELLYEMQEKYQCFFINGNREEYWLKYQSKGEKGWEYGNSATGTLLYGYERLTAKDMDFFRSLPYTRELAIEGMPPLTICHGSPEKVNGKLLPNDEKTLEIMEKDPNNIILCGHTHMQAGLEHGGKKILNAGSIGIPINGVGGRTEFLILHEISCGEKSCWEEEFVSLEYDVEKVIAELYQEELNVKAPHWCKATEYMLRRGRERGGHAHMLARAMELCEQETGSCVWPNIPERFWERAAEEILIER